MLVFRGRMSVRDTAPAVQNVSPAETAANLEAATSWARQRKLPLAFVTSCLDTDKRALVHEVARRDGAPAC